MRRVKVTQPVTAQGKGPSISAYQCHPLVLGFAGSPDQRDRASFFEEAPDARILISTDQMEVRAVGPVDGRGKTGFHWGATLPRVTRPADWRDISQDLCAAGLFREGTDWVLFTDSLGVHSVYLRSSGRSVFFATRIAPLLTVSGSLNADWEAWSSIFVLGSPLGPRTPFTEIRRLEAANGLVISQTGTSRPVSYVPRWLCESTGAGHPQELVDSVRVALPRPAFRHRPPVITLSGGWDSRLLAALAGDRWP